MNYKNFIKCVGRLFLLVFSLSLSASAQNSSGILQGIVTDENKAIIPEAKIVLRDEKGAKHETTCTSANFFSFPLNTSSICFYLSIV